MAKQSGYAARQQTLRSAVIDAAQQMERQFLVDILIQLLNKRLGLGIGRIEPLIIELIETRHRDVKMFNPKYPEADYLRDQYDKALRQICGDKAEPFDVRYEFAKDINYR